MKSFIYSAAAISIILFFANFKIIADSDFNYNKKTSVVSNSNGEVFKLNPIRSTTTPGFHDFYIQNMQGKDLIFMKSHEFMDPDEYRTSGRSTCYFEITFLNDNSKAEIRYIITNKNVAKAIYEIGLIVNWEIDLAAQKKFILQNGTTFSKRREELKGSNTIIINNK